MTLMRTAWAIPFLLLLGALQADEGEVPNPAVEGRVSGDTTSSLPTRAVSRTYALHTFLKDGGRSLAFSQDGLTLASGDRGGLRLWDFKAQKERCNVQLKGGVHVVACSPDAGIVAGSSDPDGCVHIWEMPGGKEFLQCPFQGSAVRGMAFAPDAKVLAVGYENHLVLWELPTGRPILRLEETRTTAVAFSPDGGLLAIGSTEGKVRIWSVSAGKEVVSFQVVDDHYVNSIRFSPDGRTLAASGQDGTIRFFEMATGGEILTLKGHDRFIYATSFSSDGRFLTSLSADDTMIVWDLSWAYRGDEPKGGPGVQADMDGWWDSLGKPDAAKAYEALRALANKPECVMALARDKLRQGSAPDLERIKHLIAKLDDDRYDTREQAHQALEAVLSDAEPELRKALERSSPEVCARAQRLLDVLASPVRASPEALREIRAVQLLEYIGTEEARGILEDLSDGNVPARLAREAKAALLRLKALSKVLP